MEFRWDQWFEGFIASGLLAVIAGLPAIVEGGITKAEIWSLIVLFVGGIAFYCKTHPPEIWNGTNRRGNQ